jgi:hypothetical protein
MQEREETQETQETLITIDKPEISNHSINISE